MSKLLSLGAVTLAIGCGGTSSGTTGTGGAATSSGTGSSTGHSSGTTSGSNGSSTSGSSQYNTLTGTFSSELGIQATFAGSMEEFAIDGSSSLAACSSFSMQTLCGGGPTVSISSPAGDKGLVVIGLSTGTNLPDPPVAGTWTCAPDGGFAVEFTDDTSFNIYIATSCTATLDAPTLVASNSADSVYFGHGSVTATLVGATTFSDGGSDMGTLSATW